MGKTYIAIGFWYEEKKNEDYPDPAWFVDENYAEQEREKVIDYLKKAKRIALYRGWSNCRICGKKTPGGSDDTDGLYIFPSGLVHYVDKHNLRLPHEFIKRVNDNRSIPDISHINVSEISISKASFEWWKNQKGIDSSKSSKNNLKGQNLKLDFIDDDDSDLTMY